MKRFFKKIVVWILTLEARLVLARHKPRIVGITGSVGKTSAKEAIYTALATKYIVRKSVKSYNSEIGIPLTILDLDTGWGNPFLWLRALAIGASRVFSRENYPEWLVLEIGADAPGDIERTVRWLKLDVAVITHIGELPVHVEFFPSIEALVKEKRSIIRGLKHDGVLILSNDDTRVAALGTKWAGSVLRFGFDEQTAVSAKDYALQYKKDGTPSGIFFDVRINGKTMRVALSGVLGVQHVYPVLAAFSVGIAQHIALSKIHASFASYRGASGRMILLDGVKGTVIIDDSYNSSPLAVGEALNVLKDVQSQGRKIAVLGDMMELGKYSVEAHKKVGQHAADICDVLITVGIRAKGIEHGARSKRMKKSQIFSFTDSIGASEKINNILERGDIVLIKGSQAVRLERIVESIMAHPERAQELLVRQDRVWKKR